MKEYPLLQQLNGPKDLMALPEEQLPALAEEVRGYMVDCVSKNGGHLAASLRIGSSSTSVTRPMPIRS